MARGARLGARRLGMRSRHVMPFMPFQSRLMRGTFRRDSRGDRSQGGASVRDRWQRRAGIGIHENAGDRGCEDLERGVPKGASVFLRTRWVIGSPPSERYIVAYSCPEFFQRE